MTDTNAIDPNLIEAVQAAAQTAAQTAVTQLSQEQVQAQQQIALQQQELELGRRNHELQLETRRTKINMIQLAAETLVANARAKPVDERDITAADIKTYADELMQYINEE